MGDVVKIDKIVLIDYKNHEKFELLLNGECAILVGKNGAGKTSVIEAVKRCLGMPVDKPDFPIRRGSDKATIQVYLRKNTDGTEEEYVSEETYTKKDSKGRLKLYRLKDSYRDALTSPMERLRELIGTPIDLTPLLSMSGKDQFKFLFNNLFKNREGVKVVLHDYKNLYDSRTQVNRDVKGIKAKLIHPDFAVVKADIDTYTEEKSAAELRAKKQDVTTIVEQINEAKNFNQSRFDRNYKLEQKRLEREDLARKLAEMDQLILSEAEWFENNPVKDIVQLNATKSDIEKANNEIDTEIDQISDHNKMVAKVVASKKAEEELAEKEKEVTEIEKKIENKKEEVNKSIKEIPFSDIVEGLALKYEVDENGEPTEVGLFMNELPLHETQQSYGELLKTVIKLTSYLNPDKLNFIPIRDYSLLDKENQEEIWEFMKSNPDLHIQMIAEKVGDNKTLITELVEMK